jgi:hypothetical protein
MRRLTALLLIAGAVLVQTGTAWAAKTTFTHTETRKNVVESFAEIDPCLGPITVNLIYNDIFHITEFVSGPNEGAFHVTFTQAGKFLLETEDPALGDYAGTFAVWGGFNGNRQTASGTFTFNAVGRAPDGTRVRFHALEHFNVTPGGVENSFLIETFDCPV